MGKGTVYLIEEVSPDVGYTREEVEKILWNSPPPIEGEGRYRLDTGRSVRIDRETWKKLDAWYWS